MLHWRNNCENGSTVLNHTTHPSGEKRKRKRKEKLPPKVPTSTWTVEIMIFQTSLHYLIAVSSLIHATFSCIRLNLIDVERKG